VSENVSPQRAEPEVGAESLAGAVDVVDRHENVIEPAEGVVAEGLRSDAERVHKEWPYARGFLRA
jgi:hypothetical protein